MKTAELRRLLRALGCVPGGGKGSHEKWTAPGGHSATIKGAMKQQSPGLLRGLQAQLAPEFGERWLEKRER